jgi:hypothetical protein
MTLLNNVVHGHGSSAGARKLDGLSVLQMLWLSVPWSKHIYNSNQLDELNKCPRPVGQSVLALQLY